MTTIDFQTTSVETANEAFLERHLPGTSPATVALRKLIMSLNAPRNASLVNVILIVGESGAGKNHVARVIAGHRRWLQLRQNPRESPGLEAALGSYADRFEEIHLPALPDTLAESELFGSKDGAYTGARDRPGLLGGTRRRRGNGDSEPQDLLLDEIGDASMALQAKLLQVVDLRRFRPVGGGVEEYQETSARLIMATNRDLVEMVRAGTFREDLLWRLREFVVVVPPLREQRDNIRPIALRIEEELREAIPPDYNEQTGRIGPMDPLSDGDLDWARSYEWPGNVRELRQAIRRWYFHQGQTSLSQTVAVMRAAEVSGPKHKSGSIASLVRNRLDQCLKDHVSPPGSLDRLKKEFGREIEVGIDAWYRAAEPSDQDLRALFPSSQPMSVRNKLSNWRRR